MSKIPKIIHQVWLGDVQLLPEQLRILTETWKNDYPLWKYIFWDNSRIYKFIQEFYPEYIDVFNGYQYDIQRCDAIRYLILNKYGGMYVDFDYESITPLDSLIADKSCCFALEPKSHCDVYYRKVDQVFNNALIACNPGHPFMSKIVEIVFSNKTLNFRAKRKDICVLSSTGPWLLIDLYYDLPLNEREDIYLIPAKYVTPFDSIQANRFVAGEMSNELECCLTDAYAVHYFLGSWRSDS